MSDIVAATYGTFGTPVSAVASTAVRNDPAAADKPAAPAMRPSRPLHDEPGSKTASALNLGTITANPTTWLVVTIGLAVIAARVAKTGRVW